MLNDKGKWNSYLMLSKKEICIYLPPVHISFKVTMHLLKSYFILSFLKEIAGCTVLAVNVTRKYILNDKYCNSVFWKLLNSREKLYIYKRKVFMLFLHSKLNHFFNTYTI